MYEYEYFISQSTDTDDKEKIAAMQNYINQIYEHAALVHIHFRELGVVKYRKDQLYSGIDLIGKIYLANPSIIRLTVYF